MMIQHLSWVMAHHLDKTGQLLHLFLLLWGLEGSSPLEPPPSSDHRAAPYQWHLSPLEATRHCTHSMKHLPGLLPGWQVWVFGLPSSSCHCSSPMTACAVLVCSVGRTRHYLPGALLWFDNAERGVEADWAHFLTCGTLSFGPALLHSDASVGANKE